MTGICDKCDRYLAHCMCFIKTPLPQEVAHQESDDTRRLDWLEANPPDVDGKLPDALWSVYTTERRFQGSTFREAIDAAMGLSPQVTSRPVEAVSAPSAESGAATGVEEKELERLSRGSANEYVQRFVCTSDVGRIVDRLDPIILNTLKVAVLRYQQENAEERRTSDELGKLNDHLVAESQSLREALADIETWAESAMTSTQVPDGSELEQAFEQIRERAALSSGATKRI